MSDIEYLIIGAGVSGLALGNDLQAAGKTVVLVDKGRILGGRCTTKKLSSGALVDYGAQFFTARGERFTEWTDEWLREPYSDLAIWNHGIPIYNNGTIQKREPGHPRYAPKSGMKALPQRLAGGLHVRPSTTITGLEKTSDGWRVEGHTYPGETPVSFRAKNICLTIPPEQLIDLAGDYLSERTCQSLGAVAYDPAWTVIASLGRDIKHAFPALEFKDHPLLNWISRDHTKRGTSDAPPVLVIHAAGQWSRVHMDDYRDAVGGSLIAIASNVLGEQLETLDVQTHRWRYALPTQTFGTPYYTDFAQGLFICGDAFGGISLEKSLTTGWDLAKAIVEHGS